MSALLAALALLVLGLTPGRAQAQTVNWLQWTAPAGYPSTYAPLGYSYANGATGSLTMPDSSVVNVVLTGEVLEYSCFTALIAGCTGWWSTTAGGWGPNFEFPINTFTSTNVPNVPNTANLVTQAGYVPAVARHTLTFSQPVTNIVMPIVSLGGTTGPSAYRFDQDFTLLSQSSRCTTPATLPTAFRCLTVQGRTLTGREGSGTVQFTGTFTSISWEVTVPEVYSGFNIGATDASFTAQAPLVLAAAPTTIAPGETSALSATGGSGPGAVTYTLVSGPCTLSGSTLTGTSAGACVVTATKAGDGTYASLTSNAVTVNVAASSHAVTYDANGATSGAAPGPQTKNNGTDLPLAGAGSLARTGYTFSGWNTAANGSGTSYAAGAVYTADAALTLFAQWAASYAVTYDVNGATSGTAPGAQLKSAGTGLALAAPGSLARAGYTFSGWNTAADGSGTPYTPGASYTADAAVALFAQWTAVAVAPHAIPTLGAWMQALLALLLLGLAALQLRRR